MPDSSHKGDSGVSGVNSGRGGVGRDCGGFESSSDSGSSSPVSEPDISTASSPLLPAESSGSGRGEEYISGEGLALGVGC